MAYDEHLADRIASVFKARRVRFEEKKMMGGLCYMVNDKMCCGIVQNKLMARIDPDFYEKALKKKGCRAMDFTGRPMRGLVYVEPIGIDLDTDLEYWLDIALEYNPRAKSSKKK